MSVSLYKILVIEDDPAVASSLQKGLELEGFQVTWKQNGGEGLKYLQTKQIDLVILDVRLPDGSGFDFCRQIRQSGSTLPILMLTARRDEVDKVLGLEMGADDYMTKPFSLRELVARIRAMIRRTYGVYSSDGDPGSMMFAADLVVNLDTAQVFRGTDSINLTPTEYRLLVYLVRHAGLTLSRSQILEAVWKDAFQVESERTVNVHIRRLREKVELDPSKPQLILTVPGIGYRLVKQ